MVFRHRRRLIPSLLAIFVVNAVGVGVGQATFAAEVAPRRVAASSDRIGLAHTLLGQKVVKQPHRNRALQRDLAEYDHLFGIGSLKAMASWQRNPTAAT